jgi:hypothetical protein
MGFRRRLIIQIFGLRVEYLLEVYRVQEEADYTNLWSEGGPQTKGLYCQPPPEPHTPAVNTQPSDQRFV